MDKDAFRNAASNLMGATEEEIAEVTKVRSKPMEVLPEVDGPDFDFNKPMMVWISGGKTVIIKGEDI